MEKNSKIRSEITIFAKTGGGLIYLLLLMAGLAAEPESDLIPTKIERFANYLFEEGDYLRAAIEYERYLYYSDQPNDTILFKIGLCHQFRERYDYALQAFTNLSEIQSSALRDKARLARFYQLYKMAAWNELRELVPRNDRERYFHYLAEVNLNSYMQAPDYFANISDDSLRNKLIRLEDDRKELKQKSPLLAATLSAILPGAGKFYNRRGGDALYSLAMTTFAGTVAYAAFESGLVISGVVTSGITLSFYLGTIYGSYVGAKIHNRTQYRDWYQELESLNPVDKNPYWSQWIKE